MPFYRPDYLFNPKFNIGTSSVYTQITELYTPTPPPVEGVLLISDGTDFLLSDGETLSLG